MNRQFSAKLCALCEYLEMRKMFCCVCVACVLRPPRFDATRIHNTQSTENSISCYLKQILAFRATHLNTRNIQRNDVSLISIRTPILSISTVMRIVRTTTSLDGRRWRWDEKPLCERTSREIGNDTNKNVSRDAKDAKATAAKSTQEIISLFRVVFVKHDCNNIWRERKYTKN